MNVVTHINKIQHFKLTEKVMDMFLAKIASAFSTAY